VTGASGGIGEAVARDLADNGWNLVLGDLDEDSLTDTAKKYDAVDVAATALDISRPESCAAVAKLAIIKFGRLDALVNCAGVSQPHDSLTQPPEDWARMIEIQLSGAFYIAQACGRIMAESDRGAIVFISSTNAEAAFPRRAAYCSAKAGVAMLTKVMAIEWADRGIRVNAVGPAYVATQMTLRNIEVGNISREAVERRIPLGRLADPKDVSNAVSFLLSEKASFITGQTIYVDGGWLAYGYL